MSTYSPARRTAVVFCGTGAHGAYHAGVLRALQEAGVKIDVVAGQGVGAATAALAAIDGGARLWEAGGLWRAAPVATFYAWKGPIRSAGWLALVLAAVLLTPLLVLGLGLIVYPIGFVLEMLEVDAGASVIGRYSEFLQTAFAGENLPTLVPRLGLLVLAILVSTLLAGSLLAHWRAPARRRSRGWWWWRIAGAPLDADGVCESVASAIWQLIRGAATPARPSAVTFGRRYAEVLAESIGQPGFRELMVIATDLDTRRDVVAGLLADAYRRDFVASRPGRERSGEVLDIAGAGRDHALDVVAGALTPPVGCDPHLITFPVDSFWRGETHRLCDRPGSVARLLEELSEAGVVQVIVVSAVAPGAGPHRLTSPRLDVRNRLGEFLAASESAGLRDALDGASSRFDAVYPICPAHNPVGPFDFTGAYDEASDRRQTLLELIERGYEDAYREFIEPVVGASGEHLAEHVARDSPSSHAHTEPL